MQIGEINALLTFLLLSYAAIFSYCKTKTILNPTTITLTPLIIAYFNITIDPLHYEYYTVSTTTSLIFMFFAVCMNAPIIMYNFKAPPPTLQTQTHLADLPTFFSHYYISLIAIYSISYTGFALKLYYLIDFELIYKYIAHSNIAGIAIHFETNMKNGFSLIHYTGYLALFYSAIILSRSQNLFSVQNILVILLSCGFILSLAALFIKVQFILAILLFIFTYALNNGRAWIKIALIIIGVGLIITILDNLVHSKNPKESLEFLLRYISGSIIGLDQYIIHSNNNFQHFQLYASNIIEPFVFALDRLNYGISYIPYSREFVINNQLAGVNTGTILKAPFLDFGHAGVIGFTFFASFTSWAFFYLYTIFRKYTYLLIYSLILTSLFLSFIGSSYKRLEYILIILLHLLLEYFKAQYANKKLILQEKRC